MVTRLQFPNCATEKTVSVDTALTRYEVSKDDDVTVRFIMNEFILGKGNIRHYVYLFILLNTPFSQLLYSRASNSSLSFR